MNNLDALYSNDSSIKGFSEGYLKYVAKVISDISIEEISAFIETLLDARSRTATVYFIGNGGSAATASHFANDLAIGTRTREKPFRVVSLCDNQAVITAIANDDGYEQIFSQQLAVLLKKEDVVVAISASGNSPNLVAAMEVAKNIGATTVGLTSFDGGKLRKIADMSVHIPAQKGEYGPAEDGHMILDHLIGSYLMRLARER